MKKTSGIKSKQMLVWVSNTEMFMEQTNPDKIVFKTPVGIGKSSDHFLYDQRNRRTTTFKATTMASNCFFEVSKYVLAFGLNMFWVQFSQ
ncbi:hypothetical protein K1719_032661 [Acacia pycnantha]|nr:hypothetical protein K1719_032661 [Acacia pycnantha]